MAKAEAAAARVRQEAGVLDESLIDVESIARGLGAEVIRERLGGDVSGLLVRQEGRVIIGVNESHAPARQRFTIAHELGHFVLHEGRPLVVDRARINLRDSRSSLATDLEEIEANSFAAELLMPRTQVLRTFRGLADAGAISHERVIRDLAHGFGVSDQAMEYRLVHLGLLRST